ncbi:AMP-binding protein [Maritalea sp.]|uniref:AMP-binding protein n=1 Tax=Maritalea sp. TaxID=2003361 RepID=UPI003EFA4952
MTPKPQAKKLGAQTDNPETQLKTIDHWLRRHAQRTPNKVALNFLGAEHVAYSYLRLSIAVDRTASVLQHDLGLVRGDRIAFYGKNSDEELVLIFAAAALGLIFVPLNWRLAPRELNYIAKNAGVSALFFDNTFAAHVPDVLRGVENVSAIGTGQGLADNSNSLSTLCEAQGQEAQLGNASIDDPFLLVYTSGTTGRPKGAVHTQKSVQYNAYASVDAFDITAHDHALTFLPLFHVGGINIQTLPTLFAGGTVTLAGQFSPDIFIHGVTNTKVSLVTVVPTILNALLGLPDWAQLDMSSLKCMAIGSTDVPVALIEAVHAKNVPVVQIYGATETGPVSVYQHASEAFDSVGSIGRVGLNSSIKLMAGEQEAPLGQPGEIWVKAPNCFAEYWQDTDATNEIFVDGWFKTGDIASLDENGLYWFCDRSKNIIISGGENIYPAEIERIMSQIDGVREVAVVGQPHEKWGEVPVAFINASREMSAEFVLEQLDGRIAKFKRPKAVKFVDELPKNAMGKIVMDQVKALL